MILYWSILIICNIPLYFGFGWVIFNNWGRFFESVRFWLTPDLISAFRGEWAEDYWAEMVMMCWLFLCSASTYATHWVTQTYIL